VLRRVFFLVSFFSKSMGGMTDDDICPRSIYALVSLILSRVPNLVHGRPAVNRPSCISRPAISVQINVLMKALCFKRSRASSAGEGQQQEDQLLSPSGLT